jgi:hypothetical protein
MAAETLSGRKRRRPKSAVIDGKNGLRPRVTEYEAAPGVRKYEHVGPTARDKLNVP